MKSLNSSQTCLLDLNTKRGIDQMQFWILLKRFIFLNHLLLQKGDEENEVPFGNFNQANVKK